MQQIVRSGWVQALALVALWRGLSELQLRRRELAASGVLQQRLERRRIARIDRALLAHGFSRMRVGVPCPVPVVAVAGAPALDRAVHVGSIAGRDMDDVGLLEAAMRRAASDRQAVDGRGLTSRPRRTDWGSLLERVGGADRAHGAEREAVPAWAVAAGIGGVALTLVPLVRPLADVAPLLALGGLALLAVALVGARRG